MATINWKNLMATLDDSGIAETVIAARYRKNFVAAKKTLIDSFLTHPVSVELLAGPESDNSSGTLGGYGNLFSFIGFPNGSDPIGGVLALLDRYMSIRAISKRVDARKIVISYSVHIPIEEIEASTPLPFEPGQSWVTGIEEGISGFGQYVALRTRSNFGRSKFGIQNEVLDKPNQFKTTPYLTPLFAKMLETLGET